MGTREVSTKIIQKTLRKPLDSSSREAYSLYMNTNHTAQRVNVNVVDEAGEVRTGSVPSETFALLPYYRKEGCKVVVRMDVGYLIDTDATNVYKR